MICVEKSFAHQKKEAHNTVNGNASRASNLKSLSLLVQDNDDDIYSLYMKTVKVHQFGSMDMKLARLAKHMLTIMPSKFKMILLEKLANLAIKE